MTIITQEQHSDAIRKISANNAACSEWIKANKRNGIPVEIAETFPYANEVTNELRSAVEIYEFCHDKPEKYFLYIDEEKMVATTWMGNVLGSIQLGHEYRAVFGDKRQSVRMQGINGKTYSGIYFKSAGQYARVKSVKS